VYACESVCLLITREQEGKDSCLQIFWLAPGHPEDGFRHKNLEVVDRGPENQHFLG